MPRRYEQHTSLEATGRGFVGTIFGLLTWVDIGVVILAVLARAAVT